MKISLLRNDACGFDCLAPVGCSAIFARAGWRGSAAFTGIGGKKPPPLAGDLREDSKQYHPV